MSARELRSALGLASIFGLRMLGMFIILPVFALYARTLPGGSDLTLVGIALGAYGLAQAVLQVPFGRWSDRIGRKPVLYIGLAMFALGSFVAGFAHDIYIVLLGRILQGAGAISAVAIAMAADLTREEHRTKVMAIIGSMIGLTFAVSIVAGPWLGALIGVPGIFMMTGVLATAAMLIVARLPDPEPEAGAQPEQPVRFVDILRVPELARLNVGIFVLHAVLMAMFVVVPLALEASGLAAAAHWKVYGAVMLGSIVLMLPAFMRGERRGLGKPVFLVSVVLVGASQAMLLAAGASLVGQTLALLVFFTGFNILEAALPAAVSQAAPAGSRGTAVGVYSTVQFLGTFVGAALGGFLMQHAGATGVLAGTLVLMGIWLAVAAGMAGKPSMHTRLYCVPPMDSARAMGLTERLGALPGVREARVLAEERQVRLEVDVTRFDERDALKLIAGET
jgi:MFS family permease